MRVVSRLRSPIGPRRTLGLPVAVLLALCSSGIASLVVLGSSAAADEPEAPSEAAAEATPQGAQDGPDFRDLYRLYKEALAKGDLGGAERYARKSRDRAIELKGPEDPQVGVLSYNLGVINLQLGRDRDAIAALEQALDSYHRHEGEASEHVVSTRRKLGEAYQRLDEWQPAEREYAAAIAAIEKLRGDEDGEIAELLVRCSVLAAHMQKFKRVQSYGRRAIHILEKTQGSDQEQIGWIHIGLARAEIALHDVTAARKHLDAAMEILEAKLPPDDPRLVGLYGFVSQSYKVAGKPSRARRYRQLLEQAQASER